MPVMPAGNSSPRATAQEEMCKDVNGSPQLIQQQQFAKPRKLSHTKLIALRFQLQRVLRHLVVQISIKNALTSLGVQRMLR